MPKYDVDVQLTGNDGNAFAILGAVRRALREYCTTDELDAFYAEATDGDYDHLLRTCKEWVNVQ